MTRTRELLVIHTLITEADEGTTVRDTISVHHEAIAKLEHLRSDETDVGVLELRIIVKNVNSIEDETMSIKEDRNLMLVSKGINFTKVGHAKAVTSRALTRKRNENKSNRLRLREGLLHQSNVNIAGSSTDGLDVHAIVEDVSLGSCRRTVAQNDALLVRISGLHHLTNSAEKKEFSSTLLRNEEEVRTRKLEVATIDKATSFRLAELKLRRPAVLINDDLLDQSVYTRLISRLGLEDITDSVEDCEVTVVATIGLITTEESRPLNIRHSDAASVAEEVASEHRRGECVVVVTAGATLKGLETLFGGGGVVQTNDMGGVGRNGDTQLISALEFSAHGLDE